MQPLEIDDDVRELLRKDISLENVTINEKCKLSINGLIPIQIYPTQKYASEADVFDIPIFNDTKEVGCLCMMSRLHQFRDITSLTTNQYIAYVDYTDKQSFLGGDLPFFTCDYIVIDKDYFAHYEKLMNCAPIWGGFTHSTHRSANNFHPDAIDSCISIDKDCQVRTKRHQECLDMAVRAQHPSQRFLHLYHYLELDYDYEIVKRIKLIDENNPKELWSILKMSKDDIDRITHILSEYDNIQYLERLFSLLKNYETTACRIFYEYGKDSNPLKDIEAFKQYFVQSPSISQTEFKRIKDANKFPDNFPGSPEKYREKLVKLACYWIYRARCCVAHNKLGEYHLEKDDDIKFLIQFAEPLLIEMIRYRMTIHD